MKYVFGYRFFLLILTLIFFNSCASKKDILYLQDIESYRQEEDSTFNDIRIQKNDLLAITVSSTDQKSASPFNLPVIMSPQTSSSTRISARQELQTYLVGQDGYIEFPVLGKILAINKTKDQLVTEIKKKLVKYIKEPIVTLRITNFSISVLGEVTRPGLFLVSNERITIFQALSLAGDMTLYGKRKDVLVIREDDGGQKTYNRLDFTSKDVLLSPYYYLQQNDIVIVSPNMAQVQSSAFNRNTSIWVSIAGVVLTVISILTR